MAHEDLLTAFVIITALAVVMQALLLLALYLLMKRILAVAVRVESNVKDHLNPAMESLRSLTVSTREPINTILANLTEITGLLRQRVASADAVAAELIELGRVEMARADELVKDILARVERAAEAAERGVLVPVRELSALVAGIRRGFNYFFGRQGNRRPQRGTDDEQLFV